MCPADVLHTGFRQPKIFHFPFLNQIFHCSSNIFDRYVRVNAVLIEQIDVVDPKPLQRRLAGGHQRLAAAPFAIGAGPHPIAGLGRDDELVPVGPEVLAHHASKIGLGAAVGRTVVVGEIEMRDAAVERVAQ